jgi:hypothetical protein
VELKPFVKSFALKVFDYDLRAEYLKMKEIAEEGLRLADALDFPNPFIDL